MKLTANQERLLRDLAERSRQGAPDQTEFLLATSFAGTETVFYSGAPNLERISQADFEELVERGFVRKRYGSRGSIIGSVTSTGSEYLARLVAETEEPRKHTMPELQQLRQSLDAIQREAVDAIWAYHLEHDKDYPTGIPTKRLHHKLLSKCAPVATRAVLERLGGSVLQEAFSNGPHYRLTFLGALLTSQGEAAEKLLVDYLTYVRQRWLDDPAVERITNQEVEGALELDAERSRLLCRLIRLANVGGGGSYGQGSWAFGPPQDVDELPEPAELGEYVRRLALKGYDPSMPISERGRTQYFAQQRRSVFDIATGQDDDEASAPSGSIPPGLSEPAPLSPVEVAILAKLNELVPSAARSYEQALRDLQDAERKSWRGTAVELREALREVLDQLAPDVEVMTAPGYEPENNDHGQRRTKPTMKQKARFILKKRGLSSTGLKAPQDATALVEELTASLARSVYERGNIVTHVASTRQDVLKVKSYVDSILCDVLDVHK